MRPRPRNILIRGQDARATAGEDAGATALADTAKRKSDIPYYLLGFIWGAAAGYVSVRVQDLLLTAVLVASGCMFLAFMRPERPWRWIVLIPLFIPLGEVLAFKVAGQRLTRVDISEAFFALFPAIAGGVGGAAMRMAVRNLWGK